ncbi:ribonuclease H-like domain-containing protein [Tanacetum coccineum]
MWLFKHKFHADGTLSRYKAHLVANGSSQQLGVDFDETFNPVAKPTNVRTVLSFVVSHKWPIYQLDVKNAFLNSLFLSQRKYAFQLLERAHMVNCNPSRTLVGTESKLGSNEVPVEDPTLYRSLARGLLYLTFTHPDLSYAVQQIYLYMHDPREPHLAALKRILRYVQGGLPIYTQHTLSRSSAEAEYRGVANVVAETAYLGNPLRELHSPLSTATLVYCDNVSAIYMSANRVQHQQTKHIEIDIHFVRDMVTAGQVRVLHVPSRYQFADVFTKGLPFTVFEEFRSSLSVRPPSAPTVMAY